MATNAMIVKVPVTRVLTGWASRVMPRFLPVGQSIRVTDTVLKGFDLRNLDASRVGKSVLLETCRLTDNDKACLTLEPSPGTIASFEVDKNLRRLFNLDAKLQTAEVLYPLIKKFQDSLVALYKDKMTPEETFMTAREGEYARSRLWGIWCYRAIAATAALFPIGFILESPSVMLSAAGFGIVSIFISLKKNSIDDANVEALATRNLMCSSQIPKTEVKPKVEAPEAPSVG